MTSKLVSAPTSRDAHPPLVILTERDRLSHFRGAGVYACLRDTHYPLLFVILTERDRLSHFRGAGAYACLSDAHYPLVILTERE